VLKKDNQSDRDALKRIEAMERNKLTGEGKV